MMAVLADLLTAEGIARCTGGKVERAAGGGAGGVSTDSRTVSPGSLFVALRGERFDGHRYLGEALRRGAWGVMVEAAGWKDGEIARQAGPYPERAVVSVPETTAALGDLAACRRRALDVRVVGVTGSNGKTTTKEMIAAAGAVRWKVLRNEGNLNNLIGLPLSVLRLEESHEVAVLEMGMNRRGEIARLAAIARPQVGVVTNVGPVHLEHLGSVEAVAAAKAELLEALGTGGTAVLNADDPMTPVLLRSVAGPKVTFGLGAGADFRAEAVRLAPGETVFSLRTPGGGAEVVIPFTGEHNVRNALAAAAAAALLGLTPEETAEGLRRARPPAMRFALRRFAGGIAVVDDAYNANPVSMEASLSSFALLDAGAGRRAAVLGDMRELGGEAEAAHRRLGRRAAAAGLDLLVAVGEFAGLTASGALEAGMEEARVRRARDAGEAAEVLGEWLREGDLVLFKASRSVRLESAIADLERRGILAGEER